MSLSKKFRQLGAALVGSVALTGAAASAASAADITETFTIKAGDMSPEYGTSSPAPVNPADTVFTITFDPTQTYSGDTADVKLDSTNVPELGPNLLSFYYTPGQDLYVGTFSPGWLELSQGFDSAIYGAASSTPSLDYFRYSNNGASIQGIYYVDEGGPNTTLTVAPGGVSAAPEPAAWALMMMGVGLTGFALRSGRKKAPALAL